MYSFYSLLLGCFLLLLPHPSDAASLFVSSPQHTYKVGATFSISIQVESVDQAMNAASGVLSFPWDKMEVVSISTKDSIFSLWPEQPSFSNTSGKVLFEGIALNPGFTGSNGKIATITFRAKREGQANVSFSSGSVLANDGSGTNILDDLQVSVITIAGAEADPASPTVAPEVSNDLGIISPTHPIQSEWYAKRSAEFSWAVPQSTLGVRTLLSASPTDTPSVTYEGPLSSKKIEDLKDGTYYFHLQIRTDAGWGKTSRFKIQVDTTPPKPFSITFPHGTKSLEPQPVILFNTTDTLSGVNHYDIKIEKTPNAPEKIAPTALSNPYPLPPQEPGTHEVEVVAVDHAGNTTRATAEFTIEGIDTPIITYYTEKIESGDLVKIRGTTYPNSDIRMIILENNEKISEEISRSNLNGDFSLVVTKRLNPGTYTFTVRTIDGRGAKSQETSPLSITVRPRFFTDLGDFLSHYLWVTLILLIMLGGIFGAGITIVYFLWRSSKKLKDEKHTNGAALTDRLESLKRISLKSKAISEEISFLEGLKEKIDTR